MRSCAALDPTVFESLTPTSVRGDGVALARTVGAELARGPETSCGSRCHGCLRRAEATACFRICISIAQSLA